MTEPVAATPLVYTKPKLNRPELRERLENKTQLFDFSVFGVWKLCLKNFYVKASKKPGSPVAYWAQVKVLETENTTYPAGTDANFWFPIGRVKSTDQGLGDRDDAKLTDFLLAVYRIGKGVPFDVDKGLDDLIAQGKVESDALVFGFRRTEDHYVQKVLHPVTKAVLEEVPRVGAVDSFFVVAPPPSAG